VDGRVLVASTRQPLLDAARVLAAEGWDPATVIVLRHEGSATDSLRSTVGAAAKLAAVETASRPRFAPWIDLSEVWRKGTEPAFAGVQGARFGFPR
jgi:hypothetical protein